jgi:hypothetical protein
MARWFRAKNKKIILQKIDKHNYIYNVRLIMQNSKKLLQNKIAPFKSRSSSSASTLGGSLDPPRRVDHGVAGHQKVVAPPTKNIPKRRLLRKRKKMKGKQKRRQKREVENSANKEEDDYLVNLMLDSVKQPLHRWQSVRDGI